MKTFRHLTLDERETLLLLKAEGQSLRKIGLVLNRSASSLSRELKRNRIPTQLGPAYRPAKAHLQARRRLKELHLKTSALKKDPVLQAEVVQRLQAKWSPELIAGRYKRERGKSPISHEAIYRWIYRDARHLIPCLLRSHPKRWRRRSRSWTKRLIPRRISIWERPAEIARRQSAGHWEADLLWGQGRCAIQVLVERRTRFTRLLRLPNKTSHACYTALAQLFEAIPAALRQTITYDNGIENLLHLQLNKTFGLRSYFCDPFQAWQKGTVENTNGLIRRFLPKHTNFDTLPNSKLQDIENWLNHRPRKILEFQTPAEAFKSASVALAP